jgi:hypothetical protein
MEGNLKIWQLKIAALVSLYAVPSSSNWVSLLGSAPACLGSNLNHTYTRTPKY